MATPTLKTRDVARYIEIIHADLVPAPPPLTITAPLQAVELAAAAPSVIAGEIKCLPNELAMVQAAYADLGRVLASDQFKQATLAASFTETRGLNNQEIYDLIVSRSPIKVYFTMFTGTWKQNHVWKTMGYEDSRYPDICFANRYFIQRKETCGSLILHETMHIIGFTHNNAKNTSVPYTMNRIYDQVARAIGQ